MKEKIRRLSKGFDRLEVPALRIVPESIERDIEAGTSDSFVVGVMSDNGVLIKGVVTSDLLRVDPSPVVFAGRTNYITVNVNARGLSEGAAVRGDLTLITEAGESFIPYSFTVVSAALPEAARGDIIDNPLTFELIPDSGADSLDASFPDDCEVFSELISELIRGRDYSPYAYLAYREALLRGLDITGLYESFLLARPGLSHDEIPREVVLYFYFNSDIPGEIAEKLYAAILSSEPPGSETLLSFAPRMSAFAASEALKGRINERLRIIYDAMIYPEMIDERVALCLPDILRSARITLTGGEADYLLVTYPDFKLRLRSAVTEGTACLPLYFESAAIEFYKSSDSDGPDTDVSGSVAFTTEYLFNRPDLLIKCFEKAPDHRMLLLSAAREVVRSGVKGAGDRETLIKALSDKDLGSSLRIRVIGTLLGTGGELNWLNLLGEADFVPETLSGLFNAFIKAGDTESAYTLLKRFGPEALEKAKVRKLCEALLSRKAERLSDDTFFIRLCLWLFDEGLSFDALTVFLAAHYIGSIEKMLKVMDQGLKRKLPLGDLAENILSFMLFSDRRERIDDVFRVYQKAERMDDTLIGAYLFVRSSDWFLYGEKVDERLLFPSLYDFIKSLDDPLGAPPVMLMALTAHFAGRESLSEDETVLAALIVGKFIDEGLVFRYFKALRRFIAIPEEIGWKYYIEYRAGRFSHDSPRLLMRVLPDESEFHEVEMRRIYLNVYSAETLLFSGDKLEYLIYPSFDAAEPSDKGTISVAGEQKGSNERMKRLNAILKEINAGDLSAAGEDMLSYVRDTMVARYLYDIGES